MSFSLAKNSVPPALLLIKLLADMLERCAGLLETHDLAARMETVWRQGSILEEDPDFVTDAVAITLVQVTLLAALSMHNGVLVPDLKGVSQKGDDVVLYWHNGIATKFTIAVPDAGYYELKRDICKKVFPNQFKQKATESALMVQAMHRIRTYAGLLPEVAACLTAIQSPATLAIWLGRSVAKEQLFVLLSCLPVAQLNALFMTLGNSLPEDVPLKVQQKHTLNITQVFRQPSQDAGFLIEKVTCYMELYYAVNWPILQEITRQVTQHFVRDEVVAKPAIFSELCHHATQIAQMQIAPREQIYRVLLRMLAPLGKGI